MLKRLLVLLLTIVITVSLFLTGCSKDSGSNTDADNDTAATPSAETSDIVLPETTDAPASTPITSIEFVKQNYETYGRDDVYRMTFSCFTDNYNIMASRFAGDYALFWITRIGDNFTDKTSSNEYLILTKPAVSTEQYMIPATLYYGLITVLEDGTVITSDWDTSEICVYDDKLNLVKSFKPGNGGSYKNIGFTKDGLIWSVDEGKYNIIATDKTGDIIYEYQYNPSVRVVMYVNETAGTYCFETASNDENYIHGFMFIDSSNGEITYSLVSDPELGDDLAMEDLLVEGYGVIESDYTWFIHKPGNVREMVVFPKSAIKEEFSFIQGNRFCAQSGILNEDYSLSQSFRIYDLENNTVSDPISNTEFAENSYLYANGIINDSIVVLSASETTGNAILLWLVSDKGSELKDFCDFSKQDPKEYLSDQLENLKQDKGIVITPDKLDDENTDWFGKLVLNIDFINTFKIGQLYDPDVLTAKSGDCIHPENMRNNDGTKHTFNPHVFSSYYLAEHGEKAMQTFFNYVDAVRAGEEYYECPDRDAVGWDSGRFATYFYPVMNQLSNTEYLGNGRAKIYYSIPKEEVLEKINDFEKRICDILDNVIEEDYTDFEKTLALYEFMTEYCTYDYDALDSDDIEFLSQESGYRVLMEKKGICWEISCLYKYLLLQCGIDVEEAGADPVDPEEDPHAWNYIVLDGQAYLVDATWGLTDKRKPDLKYFLFTDNVRVKRDGFIYESFDIADYQNTGMPEVYPYNANDDRYKDLWNGTYLAFDQDEKCIFYLDTESQIHRFDY